MALLWLAFRNENLEEVWQRMKVADPFWLSLSMVIAIVALVSRAVRWKILIEPLGFQPKTSNTLYALMIGYLANLAIPRIGEVTRCVTLNKSERIPFIGLVGTVIVERAIDLLMLFACILLVAAFEFQTLSSFIDENLTGPLLLRLGENAYLVLTFSLTMVLAMAFLVWWFLKNKESRFRIRMASILKEVISGLGTVLRMKNNGWFVFHTLLIWVCYFLMTYVCFFCLEATAHLDAMTGLFITVAGGLGMSAPVQGGIGAFHYVVSKGLQIFGVQSTDGITFATLVHSTQTLLVVVLGAWAFVMMLNQQKQKES